MFSETKTVSSCGFNFCTKSDISFCSVFNGKMFSPNIESRCYVMFLYVYEMIWYNSHKFKYLFALICCRKPLVKSGKTQLLQASNLNTRNKWLCSFPLWWFCGIIEEKKKETFEHGWKENSNWKYLMGCMQFITFGFACTPLYFVWEKVIGMHDTKSICLRALARLPVVIPIWFFAIIFPFFGPINSAVGALLVSFTVYIIPATAHMLTYRKPSARQVKNIHLNYIIT